MTDLEYNGLRWLLVHIIEFWRIQAALTPISEDSFAFGGRRWVANRRLRTYEIELDKLDAHRGMTVRELREMLDIINRHEQFLPSREVCVKNGMIANASLSLRKCLKQRLRQQGKMLDKHVWTGWIERPA